MMRSNKDFLPILTYLVQQWWWYKRDVPDDFPGLNVKHELIKCTQTGFHNKKTNTLNMCRECLYLVTLPAA